MQDHSSPPPPDELDVSDNLDVPDYLDVRRPAAGRVYDYYLDGAHNFEIDRAFARRMLETLPPVRQCARANRAFLRRAVEWMCAEGIEQFLDIGSGIPSAGNVHEVAQQLVPEARTLYVDYERVAASNAAFILDDQDPHRQRTNVLQADFRAPETILDAKRTHRMLDFDEPIGLLLVSLLPFIGPHDHPQALMRRYRDAIPAGSYVAMSHITSEGVPAEMHEELLRFVEAYQDTANPVFLRDHADFEDLFHGFELLDPGVVWAPEWHPDDPPPEDPSRTVFLAGVGRKP